MKNQNTPKVLLIENRITTYRREVYEAIAKQVNLTVAYSDKDELQGEGTFTRIPLKFWKIGTVRIHSPSLYRYIQGFNATIFDPDLHNPIIWTLPFLKRKCKLITWSIGFRASYSRPYDTNRAHNLLDLLYKETLKRCDANLFYMACAKNFWRKELDNSKVFIAHNTVHVLPLEENHTIKNSILFIGTLYKKKGVEKILTALANTQNKSSNLQLDIIGDGPERKNLESMAKALKIENCVKFHGAIYNEATLRDLFSQALVCISPNQAGLSVLKSMGYGVPFATMHDAITGGEIFNITNKENGFLFDSENELQEFIEKIPQNRAALINAGIAAKKYYFSNATTEIQANGVIDALNFAL